MALCHLTAVSTVQRCCQSVLITNDIMSIMKLLKALIKNYHTLADAHVLNNTLSYYVPARSLHTVSMKPYHVNLLSFMRLQLNTDL